VEGIAFLLSSRSEFDPLRSQVEMSSAVVAAAAAALLGTAEKFGV
jgi:hypothetical protein